MSQGHFHEHHRRLAFQGRFLDELLQRPLLHIEGSLGDRVEAAALNQRWFLIKHLGPLHRIPPRRKHRRLGQPLPDQLQRHQPVIDPPKRRTRKSNHVHFHPFPRQTVQQRPDKRFRLAVQVKRAVNQVHANDTQRFLLPNILFVEHSHVDDNFRRV